MKFWTRKGMFLTAVFTYVCWQNDMTAVGLRWEELLMPLLQKYKLNITWGDQDLLNVIFHHNPGKTANMGIAYYWLSKCTFLKLIILVKIYRIPLCSTDLLTKVSVSISECLLEFPCQWNYRPDHCIYGSNCASAEEDGIYILHGNRGVYHDNKQPAFRAVYEAIRKVR